MIPNQKNHHTGSCHTHPKETVYLSADAIRGTAYHPKMDTCSLFFIDETRDLCRQIVDRWGNIRNFPGVCYEECWTKEYGTREISPEVKYSLRCGRCADGKFLIVWTVRPDGRFWEDSWGFGAEDYESIRLYAFLDQNGDFDGPFRLYAIGSKLYSKCAFQSDINNQK